MSKAIQLDDLTRSYVLYRNKELCKDMACQLHPGIDVLKANIVINLNAVRWNTRRRTRKKNVFEYVILVDFCIKAKIQKAMQNTTLGFHSYVHDTFPILYKKHVQVIIDEHNAKSNTHKTLKTWIRNYYKQRINKRFSVRVPTTGRCVGLKLISVKYSTLTFSRYDANNCQETMDMQFDWQGHAIEKNIIRHVGTNYFDGHELRQPRETSMVTFVHKNIKQQLTDHVPCLNEHVIGIMLTYFPKKIEQLMLSL